MIDKRVASLAAALEGIADGSIVMIGGFGAVGQPDALIDALSELGVRDLTIVANNAGWSAETGIPRLMDLGLVRKIVCSFPKGSTVFRELYLAGKIELELVPQGTLAERIRCAGAGVPAFYTPTAVGTPLAEGKEHRDFDGRTYVLERALHADVALVEAWKADRWGNLEYRGSGRNFNPIMAMAAKLTIVQANAVSADPLDPNSVVTPGIFVNRVVQIASRVENLLAAQQQA
ncbi:3-oxoadipate CoA-transferase alpha subunit [Mesorhizobium sp. YR577]|nr:3-oxoadipate CoA-transferase alpha subunit [Mesorhizobium sp. YR577]